MNRAVLSIGSNSTRVLVATLANQNPQVLYAASIGTRIGEGLKTDGHLGDEPMARTLNALREHLAAIAAFAPMHVTVVATNAVRRAKNADAFAAMVFALTNVQLRILSGDDEARAAYRGALTALSSIERATRTRFGVIDTGGGSTEYAVGHSSRPDVAISCEIGAVRLTERFAQLAGKSGPIADDVLSEALFAARERLAALAAFPFVERLLCVGGSATSLAALIAGSGEPVPSRVLTRQQIQQGIEMLRERAFEQRIAMPGMRAQRADILLAGALILDSAFALLGHERALTTTADLPLGVLLLDAEESGASAAQEPFREEPAMQDAEIQSQIDVLVEEKNRLLEHDDAHPMSDQTRSRVEWLEVELDRLWDLLRQRRARREFGQDPEVATIRPADVVENYVE